MKNSLIASLITLIIPIAPLAGQSPRPLGTFTLGPSFTNGCPTGFSCNNFTVAVPNYQYLERGRMALQEPIVPAVATDVFFEGNIGDVFWGTNRPLVQSSLFSQLSNAGHRIVLISWVNGWCYQPVGPLYPTAASCRPATAINYIASRYGGQVNVTGGSQGSSAVAYALAFYGVDNVVHVAAVVSGPTFMEIDKGCEQVSGYSYGLAPTLVDFFFGFNDYLTTGPCKAHDITWDSTWKENSVENGGNYFYPATSVHVFVGALDSAYIRNRANDYFLLLQGNGQVVNFHVIPNMGHDIEVSQEGLNQLASTLIQ